MVNFRKVTRKNIEKICKLEIEENQQSFVASNITSLAEAYVYNDEGLVALPFGIYDDEQLIGFVMIGYDLNDEGDPTIAEGNYSLWRLMIDKKFQHQGYFKKVLDEVVRYVKTFPCGKATYLWLSYDEQNQYGKRLYQKYGFVETDCKCGDEIVAVYKL